MTTEEIREIIARYKIYLDGRGFRASLGKTKKEKEEADKLLRAAKEEIIAYLRQEKEAEEKAAAERQAKIDGIEGLKELENLSSAWEDYNYRIQSYISRGLIGKAPQKPAETMESASQRYPRAAAYLKANLYMFASNYGKSAAGQRAMERIMEGEDFEKVIADMEAEWTAAAEQSVLNN